MGHLTAVLQVAIVLQLTTQCRPTMQRDCIADIDVEKGLAHTSVGSRVELPLLKGSITQAGPHFLSKYLQLCVLHYVISNYSGLNTSYISVYNEMEKGDDNSTANRHLPSRDDAAATYLASASTHYAALGPAAWDLLTLGVLDTEERSNVTLIVLPDSPCQGMEKRVYSAAFKLVFAASNIDSDKFTITPFIDRTSVFSSQVNLFMSTGLISLFLTFMLIPPLTMLTHRRCCQKLSRRDLFTVYHSSILTATLVSGSFVFYWIINLVVYYTSETVDHILFTNDFFSPMTQCLIFYSLTGITSFVGGMLFAKCTTLKINFNCCEYFASGLFSACITAAIFHSFFLLLALLEDPVTVLSYLVCLCTTILILFLALFAIIQQFKISRFHGHFSLVVLMQVIVSSIYVLSINSFRQLTCEEEDYIATKSYLCIVTVISLVCIALSVSIIMMVNNSSRRGAGAKKKGVRKLPRDPENPCNIDKDDQTDTATVGSVGGGVVVPQGTQRFADLTTVAQEMGFVVLIPNVVQAWRKRPKTIAGGTTTNT